jgi:hypothetical protein
MTLLEMPLNSPCLVHDMRCAERRLVWLLASVAPYLAFSSGNFDPAKVVHCCPC